MNNTYLIAIGLLLSINCLASDPPFSETDLSRDRKVFSFLSGTEKREKAIGTVTLIEEKKNVKLEFEGTGLRKGKYKIIVTEECKLQKATKKVKVVTELYSFTTEYGEVSSEENLTFAKIEDLSLQGKWLVLLKSLPQKDEIISCSK